MASLSNMTQEEIVTSIIRGWRIHTGQRIDGTQLGNALNYVNANGIHNYEKLLLDHPASVAWEKQQGGRQ